MQDFGNIRETDAVALELVGEFLGTPDIAIGNRNAADTYRSQVLSRKFDRLASTDE